MNETIGAFMGYKMYNKRYPRNHGIGAPEAHEKCMIIQKAKYHSSWDALMPVVQKICKDIALGEIKVPENDYELSAFDITRLPIYALIKTVHECAYNFIAWYNQQFGREAGE